jgi:hypothetical protein
MPYFTVLIAEGSFEYFCCRCLQLRLCLDERLNSCGNCGNSLKNCVISEPGTLDKELLKATYGDSKKVL